MDYLHVASRNSRLIFYVRFDHSYPNWRYPFIKPLKNTLSICEELHAGSSLKTKKAIGTFTINVGSLDPVRIVRSISDRDQV